MYSHIYVHEYVYLQVHARFCVPTCMCICMSLYICVGVCLYVCVCIYVFLYLCVLGVCLHVYMCVPRNFQLPPEPHNARTADPRTPAPAGLAVPPSRTPTAPNVRLLTVIHLTEQPAGEHATFLTPYDLFTEDRMTTLRRRGRHARVPTETSPRWLLQADSRCVGITTRDGRNKSL